MPDPTSPIIDEHLPLAEYLSRRDRVLAALDGAIGLVFAGDGAAPLHGAWRADDDFAYLTGIRAEPGAAVLFDGNNPDPRRRVRLFLADLRPETDVWTGVRHPLGRALRAATGFEIVHRTGALPGMLAMSAARARRVACLHPPAPHTADISPDLAVFQKLAQRIVGLALEDRSTVIRDMRLSKSPAELALMRRAIEITAAGFAAVMRTLRPGMTERRVQSILESAYVEHGAHRTAYNSIVGGGPRACVLHYNDNDRELRDGDLLLIDSGAEYGGYAADITRVLPVSGRFSDRQREIASLVCDAEEAAIAVARPGAAMWEIDVASRQLIDHAGHGDTYIHGVGHHLGLSVHDPQSPEPLPVGAVITIEPGVYLPDEAIGVRIEDDVLITETGREVLTASVPKRPGDVEAAMAR